MATDPISWVVTVVVKVAANQIVRRIATAALIAAASKALRPKKQSGAVDRTTRLVKRRDSAPVREVILGTGVTAGQFVDAIAHGQDNLFYTEILKLADHPCDGLVAVVSGGRQLTVDPGTGVVQEYVEAGTPRMWIHFRSGPWDQSVHPAVTAAFGGIYASSDRGRGICDAVVVCDMRSEALFPGRSPPELRFVVRGAKLYNPALDVSRGGSQVWGDPATYVWSEDAATICYNLLRGIWIHGPATPYRLYGGSCEADELPIDAWAAEVLASSTPVPLRAGGTEPRWRAGLVASCAQDLDQTLEDVLAACAGILIETGGVYKLLVGAARTPVITITDGDFIEGTITRTFAGKARSRVNRITGRFTDPAAMWQPGALPDRTSAAALAADLGEVRIEPREYGSVQSATQGQRLMALLLRQLRGPVEGGGGGVRSAFQAQLGPRLMGLEAGDWLTWQSARRGWTKTFQVLPAELQTAPDRMLSTQVTLVEVSAADHAWDPNTDELDPADPVAPDSQTVPAASLQGFSAAAAPAEGGASSVPAIRAVWSVPGDPTIVEVAVEYRRTGAPTWEQQTAAASRGGLHITGLAAGTWQVRAVPVTRPARAATATSIVAVTLADVIAGEANAVDWDAVRDTNPAVPRPEDGATVGARIGGNLLLPDGNLAPVQRVDNAEIGIDANGRPTNVGAGLAAVTVDNGRITINGSGALVGIGSGAGTVVSNQAITAATNSFTAALDQSRSEVLAARQSFGSLLLSVQDAAERASWTKVVNRPLDLAGLDPTANTTLTNVSSEVVGARGPWGSVGARIAAEEALRAEQTGLLAGRANLLEVQRVADQQADLLPNGGWLRDFESWTFTGGLNPPFLLAPEGSTGRRGVGVSAPAGAGFQFLSTEIPWQTWATVDIAWAGIAFRWGGGNAAATLQVILEGRAPGGVFTTIAAKNLLGVDNTAIETLRATASPGYERLRLTFALGAAATGTDSVWTFLTQRVAFWSGAFPALDAGPVALAATEARIRNEETVRAGQTGALAGRLDVVETEIEAPATGLLARASAAEQRLASIETDPVTGLPSKATAAEVDELQVQVQTPGTGLLARASAAESRLTAIETDPATGLPSKATASALTGLSGQVSGNRAAFDDFVVAQTDVNLAVTTRFSNLVAAAGSPNLLPNGLWTRGKVGWQGEAQQPRWVIFQEGTTQRPCLALFDGTNDSRDDFIFADADIPSWKAAEYAIQYRAYYFNAGSGSTMSFAVERRRASDGVYENAGYGVAIPHNAAFGLIRFRLTVPAGYDRLRVVFAALKRPGNTGTVSFLCGTCMVTEWAGEYPPLNDGLALAATEARIRDEETVRASQTGALAGRLDTVETEFGDLAADVSTNTNAIVTLNGAVAVQETIASATGSRPARVGLRAGIGGSAVWLTADRIDFGDNTVFHDATDTLRTIYTVSGTNYVRILSVGATFGTGLVEWQGLASVLGVGNIDQLAAASISGLATGNALYARTQVGELRAPQLTRLDGNGNLESLQYVGDRRAELITYTGGASVESLRPAEANADVTATAQRTILPQFPVIEIRQGEAGHTGSRTVTHSARRGTTTLTGGTWSLPSTNVSGATITINSSTGTVTLSGVAASGAYTVRYTHTDGIATDLPVNVTYLVAAASGGGKIARSTAATGIDSGSYVTVLSADLSDAAAGLAEVRLEYQPTSLSGSSTNFQMRLTRAGALVVEGAAFLGIDGAGDITADWSSAVAEMQGFYTAASGAAVWALQVRRTSGSGRVNAAVGEIVINQQPT